MRAPATGHDEDLAPISEAAFDALGEAELLALAESAPVALFASVDPYGTVLANQQFLEITGRPRREILGDGWVEAVHPDDRASVRNAGRVLRATGKVDIEHRFVRLDGEVRTVRAHVVKVRDDPMHPTYVGSIIDITDLNDVEAALRESEIRFRALVEHSFDIISVIEADGTVRYTSPSGARITGLTSYVAGGSMFDRIHPDDVEHVLETLAVTTEKPGPGPLSDVRIQHADGHWIALEATATNLLDDPEIGALIVFARDVTSQRETEAALRASEERLRDQASILEMIATSTALSETLAELCRLVEHQIPHARCTVLLVSEDGQRLRHAAAPSMPATFNRAVDGLPIAEGSAVCGTAAFRGETVAVANASSDPRCADFTSVLEEHRVGGLWSTPIRASSDGRVLGTFAVYLAEVRLPEPDEEAAVDSLVQLAAVAIERNEFEDRLAHQAHHDPLTGLPNRSLFGELLDHALARAQRSRTAIGVLFLDLDRFKVVNDSLGHDAGDELLVALANRFDDVLRPGDVVARFGGDEFTVLCEDLDPDDAAGQAMRVADRIIESMGNPVTIDGDEQFVSASLGIALAFTGKERPEALLRDADAAMYRAKELGRGRSEVFDHDMRARAQERHGIENALHRAVSRGEFRVFYQPVVDLADGRCAGVEALLRWEHPDRGLLEPDDFLAAAEETSLIVPIGAWLLEEATAQAAAWQRVVPAGEEFRCSVNLSGRQLVHLDLAGLVAGVLERTGLAPDALCIEITETVLMEDIHAGISAVKALKRLGVRVSIDDFGTGYSALGYLRQFPIDEVKIDRTFVERLGTDPEDAAIVRAIVSLGHALGVTVTGEGVETKEQLAELQALGVDAAQGFLFAPAQTAADLTDRLSTDQPWY